MTQGTRTSNARIALAATVLVHAGIGWWLFGLREAPLSASATVALQVAWIDRPPPPPPLLPSAPLPPSAAEPASRPRTAPPTTARPLQAVAIPPLEDTTGPAGPDAASLLDQASDWARSQAPAIDFAADPLRQRAPPRRDGRFAMREPVSTEDVLIAIGQLFGGGPSDPCPQIRRNLANLGTGGDAELRSEEVRRLQQSCL